MSPRACRRPRALCPLVALGLILAFAIQPGTALTVENPKIMTEVSPGMSYRFPLAVLIGRDEAASDYVVEVLGFGQERAGMYSSVSAGEDLGPYSARTFLSVDPASFHLDPGERQPVNVTLRVPEKPGDGGRYALIHVHPSGAAKGMAAITTGIYVPVMITLKGSSINRTGSITGVEAGEVQPGQPLLVKTTVRNTGNHHYYGLLANLTITDAAGKVVAEASSPGSIYALIPGNTMTIATPLTTALAPGTYMVRSEAKIAEGMQALDSGSTTLTIRTAYVPPVPQTTAAAGSEGPKKLPFLPIYVPWPGAIATIAVLGAVMVLWSVRRSG
jgi:hypothetical protein